MRRVAKVTDYVAAAEGFTGQPEVMNGASDLIGDPFGTRASTSAPPSASPIYPWGPRGGRACGRAEWRIMHKYDRWSFRRVAPVGLGPPPQPCELVHRAPLPSAILLLRLWTEHLRHLARPSRAGDEQVLAMEQA